MQAVGVLSPRMIIRRLRRSRRQIVFLAVVFMVAIITYKQVWVFREPPASPERSIVDNALASRASKPIERVEPAAAGRPVRTADSTLAGSQHGPGSSVTELVPRPPNASCPHLQRPAVVRDNQTFQPVDGDISKYVFSAFLDQEERVVRVVGLLQWNAEGSLVCNLWYDSPYDDLTIVEASTVRLNEHHERLYGAVYVTCPLTDDRRPYAVSLTSKSCQNNEFSTPTNLLPVLTSRHSYNFTVCVTALNFKYSRAYELVEMIELNRLLGADKLVFYLNSVGDNVGAILQWYAARGVVDLIDWTLPMAVDHWPPVQQEAEVHYFAQMASHNDCLNRYRGTSRYLVYQDMDEFIIPKKRTTWRELIADIDENSGSASSAYLIRCVFFRKDWPKNSEDYPGKATAEKFRSVVLSTDKRESIVFNYKQRSKYIVDPKKVQQVGIHNIWSYRGAQMCKEVLQEDALLHHYRNWENPRDSDSAVRDTDMYRFKDKLLELLTERWQELPRVPLDIDISTYGTV